MQKLLSCLKNKKKKNNLKIHMRVFIVLNINKCKYITLNKIKYISKHLFMNMKIHMYR